MSTPWTPEREVTAEQARAAVRRSGCPGPADSVEVVAAGWDDTIVLVDGDWIFRFPPREVAVPGILREINWLPRLAPELPSPHPRPHDSCAALLAAYGPVDGETLLRAQTFAVSLTASLVHYAHDLGDAAMLAEFSAQLATVT